MQKLPLESLDHVLEQIVTQAQALPTTRLPLTRALESVIAHDVTSPIDVPAFTNSAMDGYGISYAQIEHLSTQTPFTVIGRSLAGHPYTGRALECYRCIQIMTGAALPSCVDTVIPFRLVRQQGDTILISPDSIKAHANVRTQGEEIHKDRIVLSKGTRLTPYHIGLLASLGIAKITVYQKPNIAIFSTGDELQELGHPLQAGQIYNVNGYALTAYFQKLGYTVLNLGILPDRPEAIQAALENTHADIFITSGGVGQGTRDYLSQSLAKHYHWKHVHIAMRPGKPLVFGRFITQNQYKYFFGLPGNPIAAMLSAQTFIEPLLQQLRQETTTEQIFQARLTHHIKHRPGRTEFVRGTLSMHEDTLVFTPYKNQGSAMFTSMTRSNAIATITPDKENLQAGDFVRVHLL